MPVNVKWANAEHTVLHYKLTEDWIWEEYHAATSQIRALMDSAGHPVDLIVVFETYDMIPVRALANFGRSLRESASPNLDQVVIVGANGMLHSLGNVLRRLYPKQMSRVLEANTIEHAMRLLGNKAKTELSS
jgi:hypothetical protein